uniref:DEAD/DEAH box helicase domain protein n=1 Tax=Solibacter usitatus (strain Ellin6076) TaxID=234267 RepID=Q01PH0_SOLUE
MTNFSELPLSAQLKSNLAKNNFTEPTPIQSLAIEPALAGKDIVATAQTGTGKTLAFLLPTIQLLSTEPRQPGVRALILTPTRELALQINEALLQIARGTGIRAAVAVGGLNERSQLRDIRGGANIVVATPGRLYDFMSRGLINLTTVRMLILDESDRMLDMGFLPTIKRIIAAMPAERQTLLFSATLESSVKQLVETHVRNAVRIELGSISKPSEQVDLHLYEVDQDRKFGLLEMMLREEQGSFLVFARTKHGADKLAKKLAQSGFKSAAIHGDRSQNQRIQALKGFQEGYYRVLVATDVAARGIHVEGISHVVNFDLPQVPEDFIHRVGRTGRAGAKGTASTFATRSERSEIGRIERTLSVKLKRREVSASIVAAPRKESSAVIVLPHAKRAEHSRPEQGRNKSFRSFSPKSGRRPVRRAV